MTVPTARPNNLELFGERRHPQPPFAHEHEEFRLSVRKWVTEHLTPSAREWEERCEFPNEVFRWCGERGLLGLKFDTAVGGQGCDLAAEAVFVEELQWCRSGGVAAAIGAHIAIALPVIARAGTPDQRDRYLLPGIRGEIIGALAVSEPDAGSDVSRVRTSGRRVVGGWIVNGSKMYITNGVRSDFIVTATRTNDRPGSRGLSLLIIDRTSPGVNAHRLGKMGCRTSDTAVITFDDVFVPDENLISEEGQAHSLIKGSFEWERIHMSLVALGAMTAWFGPTYHHVTIRQAFGGPLSTKQVVQHKVATAASRILTSRAVTYDALRRYIAGEHCTAHAATAKLATQRTACEVLDSFLQLHGGAGYLEETGIERAYRDARLGPIGGGTDEIMCEILAKELGL